MNKSLRLQLILSHLDKISAPLKGIRVNASKTAEALKDNYRAVNKLKQAQAQVSSFKKLQGATRDSAVQLDKARYSAKHLHDQLKNTQKPTRGLVRDFERARNKAAKLEKQHQANRSKLADMQRSIKKAGGSTRNLANEEARLTTELKRANTQLDKQKTKLDQVKVRQKQLANIKSKSANVRGAAGSLALQGGVAAAGAGYVFKTQFLDTAAQFEDMEATLKAVEGSSAKARQSMLWVSDFAAKTPYELAEVTEAYKKLRAFGMEPTDGLLKTLGDTASAMNTPIMKGVEAIADAVTGENERLKDFGIRALTKGDEITYQYVDRMGKQRSAIVNKYNREQIQSTLMMIWNQKYAGAMDERTKTWNGMISNLSDQWTRFAILVMDAGLFDWMKGKLGGLLEKIDSMAADGSLQVYAKEVGEKMMSMAKGIWAAGTAISSIVSTVADLVGGFDNLIYILAGLKLAPLISSMVSLGAAMIPLAASYLPAVLTGLKAISAVLLANPIGLAIAAIATAGALIYSNWEKLGPFFTNLWDGIGQAFDNGIAYITDKLSFLRDAYNELMSLVDWFGDDAPNSATPRREVQAQRTAPVKAIAAGTTQVTQVEGIHIYPTPGMDAKEVAVEVEKQLDRRERAQAARLRSRLGDSR